MSLFDLLSFFAFQVVVGWIAGFIVGYLLRRIAMVVALILGFGAIIIAYLAYRGVAYRWIIESIYLRVKRELLHLLELPWMRGELADLLLHLPLILCFTLGFYTGIKKS